MAISRPSQPKTSEQKLITHDVTYKLPKKRNKVADFTRAQPKSYLKQDLRKTFIVALVILTLEILIWIALR